MKGPAREGKPHIIRLRGPWKASAESFVDQRVSLPTLWDKALGEELSGPVTLTRKFHRPTILEEFEQVRLFVVSPHRVISAALNGKPLEEPHQGPEVTALLAEANLLAVQLDRGEENLSLLEARVEITES